MSNTTSALKLGLATSTSNINMPCKIHDIVCHSSSLQKVPVRLLRANSGKPQKCYLKQFFVHVCTCSAPNTSVPAATRKDRINQSTSATGIVNLNIPIMSAISYPRAGNVKIR